MLDIFFGMFLEKIKRLKKMRIFNVTTLLFVVKLTCVFCDSCKNDCPVSRNSLIILPEGISGFFSCMTYIKFMEFVDSLMEYCTLQSESERNRIKALIIKSNVDQIWTLITDKQLFNSSIVSELSKYKSIFPITYKARLAIEYMAYVILKKTEYPYGIYTNPKVKINVLVANILDYLNLHEAEIKHFLSKDGSSANFVALKKFLTEHSSNSFQLTVMSSKKFLEKLNALGKNIVNILLPASKSNSNIGLVQGLRAVYYLPDAFAK
jgi:hypothetical protein